MRIQYFGHCAFQITLMDGTSIVLDPFRNDPPRRIWFARSFPALAPDVVLVSHPHFDHDNVDAFRNSPTIIRHPLTIEGTHFEITSLVDRHAKAYGQGYGAWNIIFMLEAEGMRLCHWGDNRPDLDAVQAHALGHIDVLMLPVDGSQHILDFEEVEAVIRRLGPRIVFPTHYAIEDLHTPDCELEGISTWLEQQLKVRSVPSDRLELARSTLPRETEFWEYQTPQVVCESSGSG